MVLLDTNIVLYYLKGVEPVVERMLTAPRMDLAISSISAYELEYGNLKGGTARRRAAISAVMASLYQVPFDAQAAREAAAIRVDLEARGLTIWTMDLLIAGSALSRGAILATANTKEFGRVKGLRIADWTKAPAGSK